MMKFRKLYIVTLLFVLIIPWMSVAQNLPLLPKDNSVNQGVMPNGMTYYVVGNSSAKGMADFALVQKTGRSTVGDSLSGKVVDVAKDALAQLSRLGSKSPQSFLTAHGVNPGKDGFVKVTDNATVFLFDNVMLSQSSTVLDSTLLVIMDIADRANRTDDEFVKKWYTPADQAIIIAGDVDAKTVVDKLKYMSMMTPGGNPLPRKEYVWKDCDSMAFECAHDSIHELATVSGIWRMARTPREYMNTVQPAVYEMFVSELGRLSVRRIRNRLYNDGIPYAHVSFDHQNSLESLSDETFTVSVSVAPEHSTAAAEALASVMSSLDSRGATVEEFRKVRKNFLDDLAAEDRKPLRRNSDYIDRCVSAFLYNATLASQKEKLAFYHSRNLSDTTELRLFNDIASALLDGKRNFTLHYSNGISCSDSLSVKAAFDSTWTATSLKPFGLTTYHAPVTFLPGHGPKVKLATTQVEHMSKGQIWIFSNGFKVIYRRMPSHKNIYYAMALNGGYSAVPDLEYGEGAFMSDYLGLCRIAGVSGHDFAHYLDSEGIVMNSEVGLSSTVVSGHAPEHSMEKLLKILLAVFNWRGHDEAEFSRYVENEKLLHESMRGTVYARLASIDRVICPEYTHTEFKDAENLSEAVGLKADALFSGLSSKMNDGALILVGDMDETVLKKMLLSYVGAFRTTDRAFGRPKVDYRTVSGWSTYMLEGDVNSVDMVMSVELPLTIDNKMAATVAAMVLKQSLANAIVDTGMYLSLAYSFDVYPQERFSVRISLNEADSDGFASGVDLAGPVSALETVRDALSDLSKTSISKGDMAAFKMLLKERVKYQYSDPQFWVNALVERYIDGKDFTTGYEAKVDAVSEEKVMAILTALNDGTKIEYAVKKK